MATKLYFLRHGIAFDPGAWHGDSDDLRPLTDEGIAGMKQEAKYLRQINLELDALITSPLVRAQQTAQFVADALNIPLVESALLRPGFNSAALTRLLKENSSAKKVMVVGHGPDFSQVISASIGGGKLEMHKGGLARIDLTQSDPPRGELVWLATPALLGA